MKRILLISMLLLLFVSKGFTQKYVVYRMSNKVNLVTKRGSRHLRQREKLTPDDIVLIPYNTTLELFDKDSKKKYIIKTPGKGTIEGFINDNRNETVELSSRLFKFMVSWMTSETDVRGEGNSDPATVTREEAKDSTVIILRDEPVM